MVALLGGAEIPVQVGMGLESTIGGGAVPYQLTEDYAQQQIIEDRERKEAAIQAEWEASQTEKLALMEATAAEAHEQYYEVGGTGYGTTPGGPDVYYFDYGQAQPTVYEEGTFFGKDLPDKQNILNYAVLAIGAYALLKR